VVGVWIVLGVVLAAGYALSWRLRRRIWRARQVSGTRPPGGYWWEGNVAAVARFAVVTLVGAGLVLVATVRLPRDEAVGWAIAQLAFVSAVLVVVPRTRRTH
jgi:hypothetical protein